MSTESGNVRAELCVCRVSVLTNHEVKPTQAKVLLESDDGDQVVVVEEEHLQIFELVEVLKHLDRLAPEVQLMAVLHVFIVATLADDLLQGLRHHLVDLVVATGPRMRRRRWSGHEIRRNRARCRRSQPRRSKNPEDPTLPCSVRDGKSSSPVRIPGR